MIVFLIISVLIGVVNCLAMRRFEKLYPYLYNQETKEPLSMFSTKAPRSIHVFILLQFVPVLNIPFFVLAMIELIAGRK